MTADSGDIQGRIVARPRRARRNGLTLIECLVATAILSIVVLGVCYVGVAGQQHLRASDVALRAVRLAEQLMEEVESRSYSGAGSTRSDWHMDDYNGFSESAGTLKDFTGTLYADATDQAYSRSVTVAAGSVTIAELGNFTRAGKTVTVTVRHTGGLQWRVVRFIPQPAN